MQVDHVSLAVPYAKLEAEVAFLTSSMAHMGLKEWMRPHPAVVGMGSRSPFLWVSGVDNARNEIVEDGNRIMKVHLALTAKGKFRGPTLNSLHAISIRYRFHLKFMEQAN
jgi:hypothetical protein